MAAGLERTERGRSLRSAAAAAGADLTPAFGDDEEAMRPTEVAQPALVFTELAIAAGLPDDLEVVAVAGHSVGELAACAAAGALEPEAAVQLAAQRGSLMAAMAEGSMAAVIGLSAEVVERLCEEVEGTVVVANLNAPGQVVVSGAVDAVISLSDRARGAGARRVVPLRVSGAFHSPLMADAAAEFARLLDAVALRDPSVPVVTNVDAAPVSSAAILRDRLGRQMVSAVRWEQTVHRLLGLGAEVLVEVGPGSVLTGLARRIAPDARAVSIDSLTAAAALGDRLEADLRA